MQRTLRSPGTAALLTVVLTIWVGTSWRADDLESEEATSRADGVWVGALLTAFILANVAVI